ncbi:hypothetical protein PtB15_4B418 [Puccinia triticina]|nr:hypothetical protein PtB15_4B418 [Puccinia triticina]
MILSTSKNRKETGGLPTIPDHSEIASSLQLLGRLPHDRVLFEFWYLYQAGLRVRNMDDTNTRMHPRTFETLYQVKFAASQSLHPIKRSSIAQEALLFLSAMANPDGHMIGWMYEGKAIANCPGFGLTRRPAALSSSLESMASKSKAPMASLTGPSLDIVHDESYCELLQTTIDAEHQGTISPAGRLFKPNPLRSAIPAGLEGSSTSSIDPASLAAPTSASRHGSCETALSGAAFSETAVGLGAFESSERIDSLSRAQTITGKHFFSEESRASLIFPLINFSLIYFEHASATEHFTSPSADLISLESPTPLKNSNARTEAQNVHAREGKQHPAVEETACSTVEPDHSHQLAPQDDPTQLPSSHGCLLKESDDAPDPLKPCSGEEKQLTAINPNARTRATKPAKPLVEVLATQCILSLRSTTPIIRVAHMFVFY